MNKFFYLLFFFFLFFGITKGVLADSTGEHYVGTVSNVGSGWVNASHLVGSPDSSNATANSNSSLIDVTNFGFSIPLTATIDSIKIKFYGSGANTTIRIPATVYTPPAGCSTTSSNSCSYNSFGNQWEYTNSGSQGSPTYTFPGYHGIFNGWLTPSRVNASGFGIEFIDANGTPSYNLDAVSLEVLYTPAAFSISLSNVTASPSAGLVTMDLHGDFATSSAHMQCVIGVNEHCNQTGANNQQIDGEVAALLFDADNPRTSTDGTLFVPPDTYYGYGFNATSSSYFADHVQVPYRAGYNCSYNFNHSCIVQSCTDYIDSQGVTRQQCNSPVEVASGTTALATPSATLDAPANLEPNCNGDVICAMFNRFTTWFTNFFGINHQFTTYEMIKLHDNLVSRAPFAYVLPIFNLNMSAVATSSAVPVITLNTSVPTSVTDSTPNPLVPTTVSWSDPSGIVQNWITAVRYIFSLLLWVLFVSYLFMLGNRIFT